MAGPGQKQFGEGREYGYCYQAPGSQIALLDASAAGSRFGLEERRTSCICRRKEEKCKSICAQQGGARWFKKHLSDALRPISRQNSVLESSPRWYDPCKIVSRALEILRRFLENCQSIPWSIENCQVVPLRKGKLVPCQKVSWSPARNFRQA